MTEPLVSVKMITYNHARFIVQAIEGVLQQKTDFPFELVIGEDCSTDGTREIVSDYQKRFPDIVRVITSDRNVGMNQNGLRALRACRGKYLALCEGDDYWHSPHKLQKQADYLNIHEDCGMVFTDYDYYLEASGTRISKVNQGRGYRSPMDLTIEQAIGPEGGLIRTCTIMARTEEVRRFIEADPYLHQNDRLLMGDMQMFAEFAVKSRVYYYPESMTTYRLHRGSATRTANPRKDAEFSRSASEIKMYLCDKYRLPERLRKKAEQDWFRSSLRLAFHTRSGALAKEILREKKAFSWKEWIYYCGARHAACYYPFRLATVVRGLFRKQRPQWI